MDRPTRSQNMMVLPSLMEELVEEILLRLPPEEPPAHLVRAAMVCKAWRRILSDGGFRRRYCRFHRDRRAMPTLLGYVSRSSTGPGPQFVPTTSYFSPPPLPTRYGYRAIDCRHGRVLIRVASEDGSREGLIVCSLVTGIRHHLSFPACTHKHRAYDCMCSFTWAVLCAQHQGGGCDHLDCHSGPFLVVSVQTDYQAVGEHTLHMRVSVYSSETGAWSAQTAYCAIQNHYDVGGCMNPNLLIGDALYFIVACHVIKILRYDLCGHGLSVIDAPQQLVFSMVVLIEIDGGPGIVQLDHDCSVYTWSLRHVDAYGVGEWVRHNNVVQLETMIPTIYDIRYPEDYTIRFAEGTNTVLLCLYGIGVFTLDLNSRQLREVNFNETFGKNCMLPYVSFYIPDFAKGKLSS